VLLPVVSVPETPPVPVVALPDDEPPPAPVVAWWSVEEESIVELQEAHAQTRSAMREIRPITPH
jgi:hypothetical protein